MSGAVLAEAIPWSNVAMAAVFVFGFVAFCWVVTRHGGSLLDVEFRDPPERKPPEWRTERTVTRPNPSDPKGPET